MSVAAVMLCKDEADIVGYTVGHLCGQVDHVYVADNGSTDGTKDTLGALQETLGTDRLTLIDDGTVAYWQSRKTTELADLARDCGHAWVIPCDADEWWYTTDSRRLADFIAGLAPDVAIVAAPMYHHLPTRLDAAHEINPYRRINWRRRERGVLPKVACRLLPGLTIHAGNHGAEYGDTPTLTSAGFEIRHLSWRDADQYVRKIRNGEAAYALTDLPDDVGAHWRMWEGIPDEAIAAHFAAAFTVDDPALDDTLVLDPVPGA